MQETRNRFDLLACVKQNEGVPIQPRVIPNQLRAMAYELVRNGESLHGLVTMTQAILQNMRDNQDQQVYYAAPNYAFNAGANVRNKQW